MSARSAEPAFAHVRIENPLGVFALISGADGQLGSRWLMNGDDDLPGAPDARAFDAALLEALHGYFAGRTASFAMAATPRGPAFFRRCWDACRSIPAGETRSYGWLAQAAGGSAGSARAAGQAMRRNPLPVIVPCHRVLAASGALHGFAGSREQEGPELQLKAALLQLEGGLQQDLFFQGAQGRSLARVTLQ